MHYDFQAITYQTENHPSTLKFTTYRTIKTAPYIFILLCFFNQYCTKQILKGPENISVVNWITPPLRDHPSFKTTPCQQFSVYFCIKLLTKENLLKKPSYFKITLCKQVSLYFHGDKQTLTKRILLEETNPNGWKGQKCRLKLPIKCFETLKKRRKKKKTPTPFQDNTL